MSTHIYDDNASVLLGICQVSPSAVFLLFKNKSIAV